MSLREFGGPTRKALGVNNIDHRANPTRGPLLLVDATSLKRGAMEDRGVRSQPQKRTQEKLDGSANLDRGHRPARSENERSERERIRKFIHELTRSCSVWPRRRDRSCTGHW